AGDLEDLGQEVRGGGSTPGRPGAERGAAPGGLARRAAPCATAGSRPGRSAGSALTPLPRTRARNSATVNARFGLVFLPPLWAMGKSLLGLPSSQQLMRP